MSHWRAKRLPVRAEDGRLRLMRVDGSTSALRWHGPGGTEMRVCGMGRHESLRLGRDGSKDALLLEALTVCAPTVF